MLPSWTPESDWLHLFVRWQEILPFLLFLCLRCPGLHWVFVISSIMQNKYTFLWRVIGLLNSAPGSCWMQSVKPWDHLLPAVRWSLTSVQRHSSWVPSFWNWPLISGSRFCCFTVATCINGLQSIPRESNDKDVAAMLVELTVEANEESFVIVLQHGGNDVTWKRST